MTASTLQTVLALAILAPLAWAVVTDLRTRTIPNTVPVVIIGLYALHAVTVWPDGGLFGDLAVAAVALVVGFLMFAANWLGGGDAKLIAALALWAGPQHAMAMVFVIALAGGVMAAAMLIASLIWRPRTADGDDATAAAPVMRRPVPYAVAIAAGGLYLTAPTVAAFAPTGLGG
ncbi:MAG: prepilin peptidase [Rhodospirillaceae bacterium]|nr:prepilin peptidase [Rhodospirillaceae bacterium]